MRRKTGFTLAELLIALGILGVIATFSIPKVLNAQNTSKFKAIGKEAVAMVSGAYTAYQMDHTPSISTKMDDLTPFMNYVKLKTSGNVDYVPTLTNIDCSLQDCIQLHSGAVLWYWGTDPTFDGTTNTDALVFYLDPDGVDTASTQTPGKSVQMFLYFNGRITSRANITNTTRCEGTAYSPVSSYEPDWFSWN